MVCAAVPFKADNLEDLLAVIENSKLSYPCKLSQGYIFNSLF